MGCLLLQPHFGLHQFPELPPGRRPTDPQARHVSDMHQRSTLSPKVKALWHQGSLKEQTSAIVAADLLRGVSTLVFHPVPGTRQCTAVGP